MLPDRVSNPGPLTYESGALPIALRGPTLYRMRMLGYCNVYQWTILKRTSPEVKCLHLTSSKHEMYTSSVSNVIYHKFSHGIAFYTLNGENVNVMLKS